MTYRDGRWLVPRPAQWIRLNAKWGGKPTTILLRHKDTTINALTKKEYHRVIGEGLTKNPPTTGLEEKNLEQAETFYRAGTAWLISKTQDTKKYALVFRENKNYGFQRNLRGLKWIGMLVSFVALTASFVHFHLHAETSSDMISIMRSMSIMQILPMLISGVMLLCWIFLEALAATPVRTSAARARPASQRRDNTSMIVEAS